MTKGYYRAKYWSAWYWACGLFGGLGVDVALVTTVHRLVVPAPARSFCASSAGRVFIVPEEC